MKKAGASSRAGRLQMLDLILRRREATSRRMNGTSGAAWFETALARLLTMRIKAQNAQAPLRSMPSLNTSASTKVGTSEPTITL